MKSGQTYLTGLAVTDYPASTYTDRIHFGQKDNTNHTPSDTDLLKVSLALEEAAKPTKSLFKKLFNFNKDDDDMNREEFAAAMTDALGGPLLKFSQALEANTQATQVLFAKQGTASALLDDVNTDKLTDKNVDKPTNVFIFGISPNLSDYYLQVEFLLELINGIESFEIKDLENRKSFYHLMYFEKYLY